jgi:hypothetical protein
MMFGINLRIIQALTDILIGCIADLGLNGAYWVK